MYILFHIKYVADTQNIFCMLQALTNALFPEAIIFFFYHTNMTDRNSFLSIVFKNYLTLLNIIVPYWAKGKLAYLPFYDKGELIK